MNFLLRQVDSTGAALIIATHDATVVDRLPLRWTMTDRRLKTGAVQRSL